MMSFLNRNTGEPTNLTFLPIISKLITLFVILMLIPVSCVLSEQDEFQIEGEWWVAYMDSYIDYYNVVEKDEDGNYTIYYTTGDSITFCANGTMSDETGSYSDKVSSLHLTDNDVMFYDISDNRLFGYLMQKKGEENQYTVFIVSAEMALCFDGQMVPFSDGDPYQYMLSERCLYFLNGKSYVRGEISPLGENAFICTFFSESSSENGRPVVFIRTSMTD